MIHGAHLVVCILRLGQIGKLFPICLPQKMLEKNSLVFRNGKCNNIFAALLQSGNRKEVGSMEYLISFFVAVAADAVGYFIHRWLDRHSKGQ